MPTLFRRSAALLVAAGLLILTFGALAPAGAQTGPPPPFVTDYANYPNTAQAGLPAGCDFTGVVGPQFFLNGAGPFASLLVIPPFHAGDTLQMTWTSVTPVCVGVPVALTVKHATSPFFDINALQPATPRYGFTIATAGGGSVSLVLPDLSAFDADCFVQLDAIVGYPLAVVGKVPNGSFYSAASRSAATGVVDTNASTLISFNNGQYRDCVALPTTTTTTSTTVGPPTTVTVPPPTVTTFPVTPPTTVPPASTTTTGAVSTRTLAATGRTSAQVVILGSVLVLLGAAVLAAPRLRRDR